MRPEYISLYVDDKLRKGLKGASEEEVEATLDEAMSLFRFLQEKDVFERYYKQHLAKRLLSGRSTSDDAERSFIVKLKTDCAPIHEQDRGDVQRHAHEPRRDGGVSNPPRRGREGEVHPLGPVSPQPSGSGAATPRRGAGTGVRPRRAGAHDGELAHADAAAVRAASRVRERREASRAFYMDDTHTRAEGSTGSRTRAPRICERRWRTADQGQAEREHVRGSCVLMLFNAQDALSYSDILAATRIPEEDLKRSLQSLACVKGRNVLRKIPMSKEVNVSDVFEYNEQFTSKLLKVKIGTVLAFKETEPEKTETKPRRRRSQTAD